jgi:hypothetical protein
MGATEEREFISGLLKVAGLAGRVLFVVPCCMESVDALLWTGISHAK